jgi:hypothetical protein
MNGGVSPRDARRVFFEAILTGSSLRPGAQMQSASRAMSHQIRCLLQPPRQRDARRRGTPMIGALRAIRPAHRVMGLGIGTGIIGKFAGCWTAASTVA